MKSSEMDIRMIVVNVYFSNKRLKMMLDLSLSTEIKSMIFNLLKEKQRIRRKRMIAINNVVPDAEYLGEIK